MKVVILCGGDGLRYINSTDNSPKVLARIGQHPILWHIMKYYQFYGYDDFVLCLGAYKEDVEAYIQTQQDFSRVALVDTGKNTPTGGRIKAIESLIESDNFLVTYGDGVSNVDLPALIDYHLHHDKIATLTAIQPYNQFGLLTLNDENTVQEFVEKPKLRDWINGGFFVFKKEIFTYLDKDQSLERSLFNTLVEQKDLVAFKHKGFWKSMDTFKENMEFNEFWSNNKAPWKLW